MDSIDRQIILELIDDARKPFRKIANKVGVTTPTVIKRYNELKRKGVIERCSIQVNLKKLGYNGTAHLLITFSVGSSGLKGYEAMEEVQKISDIIIASRAIGDFEGYAVLAFKDIEHLYEKVFEIKKLPFVSKLEISWGIPGMKIFPSSRNPFKHPSERKEID